MAGEIPQDLFGREDLGEQPAVEPLKLKVLSIEVVHSLFPGVAHHRAKGLRALHAMRRNKNRVEEWLGNLKASFRLFE